MGMWSKVNTTPSLKEKMTGREDGRVVRSWANDEELMDSGVNPDRPQRMSKADRKAANKILRNGKRR